VSLEDARRQKTRQLVLPLEGRGEAPRCQRSGEASTAASGTERPGTDRLMEEVVQRGNAKAALKRVKQNKGSPGVDGMTVDELPEHLAEHWEEIRGQLLSGTYQPKPVKRQEIPKSGGGVRELGIPTVADRVAQTVVKIVLEPLVEPEFHPDSYGYRPGRSALDAVGKARKRCWKADWVIDLDIKAFFDSLDHELVERAVPHRRSVGPAVHRTVASCLCAKARWHPGTADEGHAARRGHQSAAGGCDSPALLDATCTCGRSGQART
jgi:group II intron reverse transcriptase/maturase